MRPRAPWLAAAASLVCAAVVAGCGLGAGASSAGTVTLMVTRDYGSKTMARATAEDPPSSETVIRVLDDNADITTRYGGGFVQSINGLAGTSQNDWFFYVNGTESPVGAAEVHVKGGDRIWWDYRDWRAAMSVPAVVGSWPQPFAQESKPVAIECLDDRAACQLARDRLSGVGVTARMADTKPGGTTPRLLVGTWAKVRSDPVVDGFRGGPASTGVFATVKGSTATGWHLVGLDPTGTPVRDLGAGAALVAALGRPPTWIVTGFRPPAVVRAAKLLNKSALRNRYAVAAAGGRRVPLPIVHGS
jgi:hypothetical protein